MIKILQGNCIDKIKELDDNSIDCVVTSPPYWGLRDYGTASYEGGDPDCKHTITDGIIDNKNNKLIERPDRASDKKNCVKCGAKRIDKQLGLEPTYQEHIQNILELFRVLKPKLKESATIWLNYGDSYAATVNGTKVKDMKKNLQKNRIKNKGKINGVYDDRAFVDKPFSTIQGSLKPKDLVMIPNRIAIALQDDGWWIRSEIIWHKPNPMPESVRDRPTSAHEKIWLITKNKKYYYDADAIREPLASSSLTRLNQPNLKNQKGSTRANGGKKSNGNMKAVFSKKNIKGNFSERGVTRTTEGLNLKTQLEKINPLGKNKRNVWTITTKPCKEAHFATFPKDLIEPCIKAGCPEGGIVLDPFGGSGTTGIVAAFNNRNAILIELNQNYIDIANKRIDKEVGLFND